MKEYLKEYSTILGLILMAYLVYKGVSPEESIKLVEMILFSLAFIPESVVSRAAGRKPPEVARAAGRKPPPKSEY